MAEGGWGKAASSPGLEEGKGGTCPCPKRLGAERGFWCFAAAGSMPPFFPAALEEGQEANKGGFLPRREGKQLGDASLKKNCFPDPVLLLIHVSGSSEITKMWIQTLTLAKQTEK